MDSLLLSKIHIAQEYLKTNNLDAWVLYQFIDENSFFDSFVGKKKVITRRAFLVIPKTGDPYLMHGYIDYLDDLGFPIMKYMSYADLEALLKKQLGKYKRIAMEYSPMSKIPHISKVDAGIIDLVRSLGIEIVSSGDLLQLVTQYTDAQIDSHLQAAKLLDEIRRETFDQVSRDLKEGKTVSEYSIQQLILKKTEEKDMVTVFTPDININENGAKGHYSPTAESSLPLRKGDVLLVDMWAKLKGENDVYADITWMYYRGSKAPDKVQKVYDSVVRCRDAAVKFMKDQFAAGKEVKGWEVDKAGRDHIESDGYGKFFTHRLGHSLGASFVHGNLVHFDNFENIDDRRVLNGHLGTVEPGIYLENEFGVRSEINVLVRNNNVEVTTEIQKDIYYLDN